MMRIMSHDIILSIPVSVPQMQFKEIFRGGGGYVAHCQRMFFDDSPYRFPDVEESVGAGEEVRSFGAHELCDAQGAGFGGVVAVDEHDGGALGGRFFVGEFFGGVSFRADGVVEDEDAGGALGFLEEGYDFGVEVFCGGGVVVPLVEGGLEAVEGETFFVYGEGIGAVPAVVDGHFVRIVAGFVDVFRGF